MNLFAIGNGFDKKLHHLPTAYSDFRDYLVEKYPGCEEYDDLIPESRLMPDGSEKFDIDDVAGYISRTSMIVMVEHGGILNPILVMRFLIFF